MSDTAILRDLTDDDLPILFEQQLDPEANEMAGFTAKDPADRRAFVAKWARIRADESIVVHGHPQRDVAGSVLLWRDPDLDAPEVRLLDRQRVLGSGSGDRASSQLRTIVPVRPLYGRAAGDNIASIRVLETR